MSAGEPVGLPGLAALTLGFLAFVIAMIAARRRRGRDGANAQRSRASWAGILVQGFAIGLASFGVMDLALDPLSAAALVQAAVVALLMAAAVGLFTVASRAMGRNWSLVARTRSDHELVTWGPFAHVRHPIYVALFLLMLALAVATGHPWRLIVCIPLYAFGTWLRIGQEERLLRAAFGERYEAYAARVARFVPGLF